MHGKQTKFKIATVIISSVLAVCIAVITSEIISCMHGLNEAVKYYCYTATNSELLHMSIEMIKTEPDIQKEIALQFIPGLLFAGIGLFAFFRGKSFARHAENDALSE